MEYKFYKWLYANNNDLIFETLVINSGLEPKPLTDKQTICLIEFF